MASIASLPPTPSAISRFLVFAIYICCAMVWIGSFAVGKTQRDIFGYIEAHPGTMPPAEPWAINMLAGYRLDFYWLVVALAVLLLVWEWNGIFKRRFYFYALALAVITSLGCIY